MKKSNVKKICDKVVTMGEIMLRLTPPDYSKIERANNFLANYGGGEANVAVSLSHFGHNCYFLTKLPPNELGDGALRHLKGHGVNVDYVVRGSSTMGIYFLESGFGGRPGKVIYNRKHSAATRMEISEFDWEAIFKDATWFHLSGITLALSATTRNVALRALKEAKKYGVKVSFDFNYRSKLWTIEEAKQYYPLVMPYVDTLFASPYDLTEILGLDKSLDEDALFRKAIETYEAIVMTKEESQLLECNAGDPAFLIKRITWDDQGRMLEYTKSITASARSKLEITMYPNSVQAERITV